MGALALLATSLLVLLVPGCGRTSLEPESLSIDGGASACGPSTCPSGCCDASGKCQPGREVGACGSAGGRCSDCAAGGYDLCTRSRVCARDDAACSPSTCDGCCAFDDGRLRCSSGTQAAACGSGGAQCADCAAEGRACDEATRACGGAKCDSTNCAGCCVGDLCLAGEDMDACGTGGERCGSCASGQVCRAVEGGGGSCEGTPPKCGPGTCAGCCIGDQCVTVTSPAACGAAGQACTACGPNEACSPGGACVPASGDCNPSTCAGCCFGDICAVGTQSTACGAGGQLCVNCAGQSPPRVCAAGVCKLPSCGPSTCPNGCCSGDTCVVGTRDEACGPRGGAACQDCASKGQTCQARQCRDKCGPSTCAGCCQNATTCVSGIANNACGSGGATCANCNMSGSFCNGLVVPRRCNDQQSTCPAPYGACAPGSVTPITPARQGACTDAQLDSLVAACAGGPNTAACGAALASLPAACVTCLQPFRRPFDERAGLFACAASFVNAPCRRVMGCATDCADESCDPCLPTSEGQCYSLVNGSGGQCRTYALGTVCADGALSAGQVCSQYSYADYGSWLRGVGDHFCGNGP